MDNSKVLAVLKQQRALVEKDPGTGCRSRTARVLQAIRGSQGSYAGVKVLRLTPNGLDLNPRGLNTKWHTHFAAKWQGDVYDDAIGVPIPEEEYLETLLHNPQNVCVEELSPRSNWQRQI